MGSGQDHFITIAPSLSPAHSTGYSSVSEGAQSRHSSRRGEQSGLGGVRWEDIVFLLLTGSSGGRSSGGGTAVVVYYTASIYPQHSKSNPPPDWACFLVTNLLFFRQPLTTLSRF